MHRFSGQDLRVMHQQEEHTRVRNASPKSHVPLQRVRIDMSENGVENQNGMLH